MKEFLTIAATITVFLMASCESAQKKEFSEFPVSHFIKLNEIAVPDILGIPIEITIHKNMAIICDQETDWFFKVFSLEDFEYLGNLVRRGNGPKEEIEIAPFIHSFTEEILYHGTGNIKTVDINSFNADLEIEVIQEFALPVEMFYDYDIFLLKDKLYSSNGLRPFERDFQAYCIETGKLYQWGKSLPLRKSQISQLNEQQIPIYKVTSVKPDKQLLAIVYNLLPIVRIYCAESGLLVNELHIQDSSKNLQILLGNSVGNNQEEMVNYYLRIKSTDEYIYALYSGKPFVGTPEYNIIHVWDWEGNPVMKIDLNISLASFDVSPDNKSIVGISMFETEKIFWAEIPWEYYSVLK